jgi:hypothetical protein
MGWFILANIFSALLTLIRISFRSDLEKDLEILILGQQLHILQRKRNQTVKPDRVDKMILGVFAAKLKLISENLLQAWVLSSVSFNQRQSCAGTGNLYA